MSSIGFSTKHSGLPARDKNLMPFSFNTIPPFFCLASNAFSDIGSVGQIEKKKKNLKKIQMKSRNSRPWYPRTTLKVNIHIIWINKMDNIL